MENMKNKINCKILVMSGKGGVGKTTVASNLAVALSEKGHSVGLLDIDIHGPNVPRMLGLENKKMETRNKKFLPVNYSKNLKVVSVAFLVEKHSAVIWRGPLKHKAIQQLIEDTEWGPLDYLIIDSPPGTGDELISAAQLLEPTGSVIVSLPQDVSLDDAKRAISFSRQMRIPVIGMVENMSGNVFGKGAVESFSKSEEVGFLGSLVLDREISESGSRGKPFAGTGSENAKRLGEIAQKIIGYCSST